MIISMILPCNVSRSRRFDNVVLVDIFEAYYICWPAGKVAVTKFISRSFGRLQLISQLLTNKTES